MVQPAQLAALVQLVLPAIPGHQAAIQALLVRLAAQAPLVPLAHRVATRVLPALLAALAPLALPVPRAHQAVTQALLARVVIQVRLALLAAPAPLA